MLKSDIMDRTPITPISMESLRYWMRDQADHAIFVHNDLTADHVADADKAFDLSIKFQGLEDIALRKKDELDSLVNASRSSVIEFVGFQNELLREQMTGHLLAKGYPTFRDHLVRESQYFLRLIDAPTDRTSPEDILSESIFWLRQMVEHSLFLTHWADPYETGMVSDGQAFAGKFDELLARARLFASMMSPQPVPEDPRPLRDKAWSSPTSSSGEKYTGDNSHGGADPGPDQDIPQLSFRTEAARGELSEHGYNHIPLHGPPDPRDRLLHRRSGEHIDERREHL